MVFRLPQLPVLDNVKHIKTSVGKIGSQSTSPIQELHLNASRITWLVICYRPDLRQAFLLQYRDACFAETHMIPFIYIYIYPSYTSTTEKSVAQKCCTYSSTSTTSASVSPGLENCLKNSPVRSSLAKTCSLYVCYSNNKNASLFSVHTKHMSSGNQG